jgi:bisphosphoglycerate-independent phosphoglycerate mutase (AlkP superfamily)
MKEKGIGKIASISGRFYSMDRDKRWQRVRKAYDALVKGIGEKATSATKAIEDSYQKETFDEFVLPTLICNGDEPIATISANDFKNKMPRQICSSVHWTQTIENMIQNGVDIFVEIGPGKVLAGLNKKISSDIKTFNIYDKESLENTVSALKEELSVKSL